MSKTQTIQAIYEAFGRGDVQGILAHVADDVRWDNTRVASRECPWNGDFSGKTHLPGFFKAVAEAIDIKVFNPHTFIESGNHVAVLLRIESTVPKNGASVKNDSVHVWTFNPHGKVAGYQHYNDTAAELAAWRA